MIKAVLIDDEHLALEQLQYVLGHFSEIEITALFTDPLQALEQMAMLNPDVVFLDIEMPEVNGLTVAEEILAINKNIFLVFVTAFDEYAINAFEVNALDYLLKPVTLKRMTRTLEKLVDNLKKNKKQEQQKIQNFSKLFNKGIKKVFVRDGDKKIQLLNPKSILLFTSQGREVNVITKGGQYKTDQTLGYWEERLAGLNFFRCHRSFLINLDKVDNIVPMFNNNYFIKLLDYTGEIPISRTKMLQLKELLSI